MKSGSLVAVVPTKRHARECPYAVECSVVLPLSRRGVGGDCGRVPTHAA
jgi:hypothetical protein